jgi:uncharacterized protein
MRILLDPNVALSVLLWRGTPYRVLEAARRPESVRLSTSAALLEDLADVLGRPFAAERLALIDRSAKSVLADYAGVCDVVVPVAVPRVVPGDPDDDEVFAAALAARVDLIVSGDRRHLLPMRSYRGIPIVDAADALRRIE